MMDLYIGDPVPVSGYSSDTVDQLMEVVHGRMREMLAEGRQKRRLVTAE